MSKKESFTELLRGLGVKKYLISKGSDFSDDKPRFDLYLLTNEDGIDKVNAESYSFIENQYGYDDEDSSITLPRAVNSAFYNKIKQKNNSLMEVLVDA